MTVPLGVEIACESCGRISYKRGVQAHVEAAVNPEGIAEVVSQLAAYRHSPKEALRRRYFDLEERFTQMALYGKVEVPSEMRALDGELWELKTSEDRVPFYRSRGGGHPLAIRLLFLFAKATGKTSDGKTPPRYTRHGNWVMKGDEQIGKVNAREIAAP